VRIDLAHRGNWQPFEQCDRDGAQPERSSPPRFSRPSAFESVFLFVLPLLNLLGTNPTARFAYPLRRSTPLSADPVHEQGFREFAQQARAFAARINAGPVSGAILFNFPKPQPDAAELRQISGSIIALADAIDGYLRRPR
jgi:hypothetical protein